MCTWECMQACVLEPMPIEYSAFGKKGGPGERNGCLPLVLAGQGCIQLRGILLCLSTF